ncbi:MAG: hypothetical protein IKX19_10035, partial [Clostridia bacterium]|nr:hypothetical protein [Clostridia bacterium]
MKTDRHFSHCEKWRTKPHLSAAASAEEEGFASWRVSADGGKFRRHPYAAVQRKIEARAEALAEEWSKKRSQKTARSRAKSTRPIRMT